MKSGLVALLAATAAQAVPQFSFGGAGLPLAKQQTLTPKLATNSKRIALKYGPFELLAKDVSGSRTLYLKSHLTPSM
jgi:hypothetical protein